MRWLVMLPVVLPLIATSLGAQAAGPLGNGTFVYSSLCWQPDTAEARGYRITLIRARHVLRLLLEWSADGLQGPLPADRLTLDARSGRIAFSVALPPDAGGHPAALAAQGRVDRSELVLQRWDWGHGQGPQPIHVMLPRVWEAEPRIGVCPQ